MGRSLMQINVVYDGKPISLLTTHLESTRDSREERIRQLQICLQRVTFYFVSLRLEFWLFLGCGQ